MKAQGTRTRVPWIIGVRRFDQPGSQSACQPDAGLRPGKIVYIYKIMKILLAQSVHGSGFWLQAEYRICGAVYGIPWNAEEFRGNLTKKFFGIPCIFSYGISYVVLYITVFPSFPKELKKRKKIVENILLSNNKKLWTAPGVSTPQGLELHLDLSTL